MRLDGRIKRLVRDRGFGFITSNGSDHFFHASAVRGGVFDSLQEGQTVTFIAGNASKGLRAEDVAIV